MEETKKLNFLEEIIEEDLRTGKVDSIMTRFPPEPNGYLHLGHAKSLCINFEYFAVSHNRFLCGFAALKVSQPDGRFSGHWAVPLSLAEGSGDRREPVPGAGSMSQVSRFKIQDSTKLDSECR